MDQWHLIVGLGNPGGEYARTRHNAGFMLVERLGRDWQADWRHEDRFRARLAQGVRSGRRWILCQPQTYMNASGGAVASVATFYRVPPARVLVAVDDADLSMGTLRLRPEGSSGGHHGLESVERCLGTRTYPRLRLGIGRQAADGRQITGHVLGRFSPDEAGSLARVMEHAAAAVECWLVDGVTVAMNRFNGAVTAPPTKES
jgi:PTH1 family peptidyl-tRNA hydrolase